MDLFFLVGGSSSYSSLISPMFASYSCFFTFITLYFSDNYFPFFRFLSFFLSFLSFFLSLFFVFFIWTSPPSTSSNFISFHSLFLFTYFVLFLFFVFFSIFFCFSPFHFLSLTQCSCFFFTLLLKNHYHNDFVDNEIDYSPCPNRFFLFLIIHWKLF